MKKIVLILCLSLAITGAARAQTSALPAGLVKRLPDETAVVKDSTGKQYPYDAWMALINSRKYSIKANGRKNPDDKYPEYLLYSLYDANGERIVTAKMERRRPAESEQFKSGDVFKPFKDKDINGEKFDLKKMTGKVFVINFWFIGCPPCRAEIPDLNKVVEHYKGNDDVVFIALCLDEGYRIKDFIQSSPYEYHIISDSRYLADRYGVHLFPTNVVVNREGKVVYSSVGGVASNPYWMKKTIDEALQQPVSTAAPAGSK